MIRPFLLALLGAPSLALAAPQSVEIWVPPVGADTTLSQTWALHRGASTFNVALPVDLDAVDSVVVLLGSATTTTATLTTDLTVSHAGASPFATRVSDTTSVQLLAGRFVEADVTDVLLASPALVGGSDYLSLVVEASPTNSTFVIGLRLTYTSTDRDGDDTNERVEDLSFDGTTLSLTEAGDTWTADLSSLRDWSSLAGVPTGLADGTDDVDDADADPTNELQSWSTLPGIPPDLADGTDDVDDADADPTNELQSLGFDSATGTLTLSGANAVDIRTGAYALSAMLASSPDDLFFPNVLQGDDAYVGVDLPFPVVIDGTAHTHVTLSTNGWIAFGTLFDSYITNFCLPAATLPVPVIAYYWDDMVTAGRHIRWGTLGTAGNRVFIVDFDLVRFSTTSAVRGQVQIHEGSGLISVKYHAQAPDASGQAATIGFQSSGSKAYPISCDAKVLDDNLVGEGWSVAPVR